MNFIPSTSSRGHSRIQALKFLGKAWVFRFGRWIQDAVSGPPRYSAASDTLAFPSSTVIAESRAILYSSDNPAEFALQAGKVQNLRVAAGFLNGLVLPP